MATYKAGDAAVDIYPAFEGFVEKLRAQLEAVDARLAVTVDLDDAAARAELDELTRPRTASVTVVSDTAAFGTDVDKATTAVSQKRVRLPVDANLDSFQKSLIQQVDQIQRDAELKVPLTVDGEKMRQQLREAANTIRSGIREPLSLDPSTAAQTRSTLQNIVRDFGVGVQVQLKDLEGGSGRVSTALKSVSSDLGDVAQGAVKAAEALHAMDAIRFSVLASGITALIPLLGGLVSAIGGTIGVLGGMAAAIGIGGDGVVGALKAMKDAGDDNGRALQDTAEKQKEALQAVTDAQNRVVDAQHAEKEALQAVTDAEHEHQSAVERVTEAQRTLTDARRDARNELDNLALAERRGQLSERSAQLGYERARVNLQKVTNERARGRATDLDVREAQLQVDTASQDITDVRIRNQQQRAQTAEATSRGVEGSERVTQARQGLVDAQYSIVKSQQAVAQANFNVIKSQQALTDSIHGLERAEYESKKASEDAAGGTDKLGNAMAKLSPNAREFVQALVALGPQWTALRLAVSNNLFAGLGDSLTRLANDQLPHLKSGLSDIATGLNSALRDTFGQLDSTLRRLESDGTAQRFVAGMNQALQGLAPVISGIVSAFSHMVAVMGPALGQFGKLLGEALGSANVGKLGASFVQMLNQIMPTLTQFISALSTGLAPVLPVVGDLLNAMGQALIPIIPSLSQIATTIGSALVQAIQAIAPSLPTVAKAFADILAAVAPLVKPLADLGAVVLGAMAQSLADLARALAPVITALAQGLQPIMPIIAQMFRDMEPLIAQMATALGTAMVGALTALMPSLPPLIKAFTDLLIAIDPILPDLAKIVSDLLPPLAKGLADVAGPLATVVDWMAKLFSWVDKLVDPLLKVVDKILEFAGKASGFLGHIFGAITSDPSTQIPHRATGGPLPSTGTSGVDGILAVQRGTLAPIAWVDGSEWVINRTSSRHYDRELAAINAGTFPKLPGYAAGGVLGGDAVARAEQWATSKSGTPYVFGGLDCSMFASGVYQELIGGNPDQRAFDTTAFATPASAAALGFLPGLSGDFQVGVTPLPGEQGHMAFTLGCVPGESGGAHGNVLYGAGAAGANDPQFSVQYSLPGVLFKPPEAAGSSAQQQAAAAPGAPSTNPSDYSSQGTYIGPGGASVDKSGVTNADLSQAQDKDDLSLQGFGRKLADAVTGGILSGFGAENSILSNTNPWNKAFNELWNANKTIPGGIHFGPPPPGSKPPFSPLFDAFAPPAAPGTSTTPTTPGSTTTPTTPGTRTPTTSTPAQGTPAIGSATGSTGANPPAAHQWQPGGGVEQWRGTVVKVLAGTGRDPAEADRVLAQMTIEDAAGDPTATNNWDVNAQNGTPSIGLLQIIKPNFDKYEDPRFPGTQTDPEANIAASLNYAEARYGSIDKIWPVTGGYANGGWITGPGGTDRIPIWATAREFMVRAPQAQANAPWLEAINAGATLSAVPDLPSELGRAAPAAGGGHDFSTHVHEPRLASVDDLVELANRQAERKSLGIMAALS